MSLKRESKSCRLPANFLVVIPIVLVSLLIFVSPLLITLAQAEGDANLDGIVTSADITCVILGIFGQPCPMPDCNQDGSVTSADITCVILDIFSGDGDDGEPVATTGAIQGSVTSPVGSPLNAVHVRAVNLSDNSQLSAFSGIGSTGSDNRLSNLSGTNTKLIIQNGIFLIENVPAGNYRVLIEKLDGRSGAFEPNRYSAFVDANTPQISFPDEYYNGEDESSTDNPLDFVVVTVNAGQTSQNINIIANAPTVPSGCLLGPIGDCGDGSFCAASNPVCVDRGLCCFEEAPCLCPDSDTCVTDLSTCPPPSPPLLGCPIPPLNTDFSDRGFFFVDSVNAILIGITSDGENVALTLSDIPDSGTTFGVLATAVSGNECDIFGATLDNVIFFDASGTCLRLQNGEMLQVNNFTALGVPLGVNPKGDCDSVIPFDGVSSSLNEATQKRVKEIERSGSTRGLDTSQTHVLDLVNELEAKSGQ